MPETMTLEQLNHVIAAWKMIDPEMAIPYESRRDQLLHPEMEYDPDQQTDDDDDL
jgi:hypothetical protein